MPNPARESMLAHIGRMIESHGFFVYSIFGGQSPRFAYTIGLSEAGGAELVLAGACVYSTTEVKRTLDAFAALDVANRASGSSLEVPGLGVFTLRPVHRSWAEQLILGALDYFDRRDVPALQVVPDRDHWTLDVPDLARPRSAETEPAWRWLDGDWEHAVPEDSKAVTNLAALKGAAITEAARWEPNQWELFAGPGPDVPESEVRVVPLGVLLAADPTLLPALDLEVEQAMRREAGNQPWEAWGS